MRDHLKGFSILELLVVVAIVAIMAGVAYPNFMKWYMKKELHADALKLFDYLREVQQLSQNNNAWYRVRVTGSGEVFVDYDKEARCDSNWTATNETLEFTLSNSMVPYGSQPEFCSDGSCRGDGTFKLKHKEDPDLGLYKITRTTGGCLFKIEKEN